MMASSLGRHSVCIVASKHGGKRAIAQNPSRVDQLAMGRLGLRSARGLVGPVAVVQGAQDTRIRHTKAVATAATPRRSTPEQARHATGVKAGAAPLYGWRSSYVHGALDTRASLAHDGDDGDRAAGRHPRAPAVAPRPRPVDAATDEAVASILNFQLPSSAAF